MKELGFEKASVENRAMVPAQWWTTFWWPEAVNLSNGQSLSLGHRLNPGKYFIHLEETKVASFSVSLP